jgi:hypothetical protein
MGARMGARPTKSLLVATEERHDGTTGAETPGTALAECAALSKEKPIMKSRSLVSIIRYLSPLLLTVCAGCGAEDMGPLEGEEEVATTQEPLIIGNWMSGPGGEPPPMKFFTNGPEVCEVYANTGLGLQWVPGRLSGTLCKYRNPWTNSNASASSFRTLRGTYSVHWSALGIPIQTIGSNSPGQLTVCVNGSGEGGFVRSGTCRINDRSNLSNFYYVTPYVPPGPLP